MARTGSAMMLSSIEVFCAAADLGSFTAAAVRAGLTPAAVSRAVGRLEARLSMPLFVRSTRHIRLTDAGRAYHVQCKQALAQLAEAERELTGRQIEPAGLIRVSAPTSYGHTVLLPLLPAFRERHPGITLEVHVSNRNVDFTAEPFDLAIRARTPPDSGLIARKLMDARLVVAATPAYLERAGIPRSLADLPAHDCNPFLMPRTGRRVPWVFRVDGADVDVDTRGPVTVTDDVMAAVTLGRAGAGLLQTYAFLIREDLARGRLVEVLPSLAGRRRQFSAIYPATRHLPLRVRLFIDFLAAHSPGPGG